MDTTAQETYNITHKYLIVYDEDDEVPVVSLVDEYPEDTEIINNIDKTDNEIEITMEDINKHFKFVKDSYNFGTITKGSKVELEYPFEGDSDVIEFIKPSCGCTAAVKIDKENNKITATYDSAKDGHGGVSKSIVVYFKDNKALDIKNSLGVSVKNPGKAKFLLRISGTIVDPNGANNKAKTKNK